MHKISGRTVVVGDKVDEEREAVVVVERVVEVQREVKAVAAC